MLPCESWGNDINVEEAVIVRRSKWHYLLQLFLEYSSAPLARGGKRIKGINRNEIGELSQDNEIGRETCLREKRICFLN